MLRIVSSLSLLGSSQSSKYVLGNVKRASEQQLFPARCCTFPLEGSDRKHCAQRGEVISITRADATVDDSTRHHGHSGCRFSILAEERFSTTLTALPISSR